MSKSTVAVVAALLTLGSLPLPGHADPSRRRTENTPDEGAAPPAGGEIALPELPHLRLVPMPGFDDEAAFVRASNAEAVELAQRAALVVNEPARRIGYLLAAANLTLSRVLEPACSTRLLELSLEEPDWMRGEVTQALDRVDEWVSEVSLLLDALKKEGPENEPGWVSAATQQHEVIRGFATAFRAYLLIVPTAGRLDPGDDRFVAVRDAASRLSPLLEDPNPAVASAVALYQAALRAREQDLTPAVAVLDPALADPAPESMPYAYFARLLRCRLLAQRGSPVIALALLMQLEERSMDWMSSDEDREPAVRAAEWMRIRVLQEWNEQFEAEGASEKQRWCAEQLRGLIERQFKGSGNTLLRLRTAVPVIATAPNGSSGNPTVPGPERESNPG